jgi:hypothetical protein
MDGGFHRAVFQNGPERGAIIHNKRLPGKRFSAFCDSPGSSLASPTGGKQAFDHAPRLMAIATAEQIEMVQHMIKIIEFPPRRVSRVQWPGLPVRRVKRLAEAAE